MKWDYKTRQDRLQKSDKFWDVILIVTACAFIGWAVVEFIIQVFSPFGL